MKLAACSTVIALLSALSALCDTVTKNDHLSVNGSLTRLSDGVITLEAQFAQRGKTPEIKVLHISISDVESVEFNYTTFNSGAPPKALGITPAPVPSKEPLAAADQLLLRGGQLKACKLIGIDQEFVHCAGKDGDYPRRVTRRIQVGAH